MCRDYSCRVHPKVIETFTQVSQSRQSTYQKIIERKVLITKHLSLVYDALLKLQKKLSNQQSDTFERRQYARAMSNLLDSMRRSGVGLEDKDKERFNTLEKEVASLGITFSNNVLDATKAFTLEVHNGDIVKRCPKSIKALWAENYTKHNQEKDNLGKSDPDSGKYCRIRPL
jgi:Zn-dependent oligopeptidase